MPDYLIESGIELPEADEEDEVEEPEVIEVSSWVPYKPNAHKCKPKDHIPQVGKCYTCGDIFPCPSGNCGHFDCADPGLVGLDCQGNGTAVPEDIFCHPIVNENTAIPGADMSLDLSSQTPPS